MAISLLRPLLEQDDKDGNGEFDMECLFRIALLGAMASFLVGCSDTGRTSQGRPLIRLYGAQAEETSLCQSFYDLSDGACLRKCKEGTHVGSAQERERAKREAEELDLEEEEKREILDNIDSAEGVCAPGTGVLRPNHSVFVNRDVCICLEGKPDTLNNCAAFCAKKNTKASTLYASVSLGDKILNNPKLGSLKNWCEVELSPDYPSPQCVLQVSDGEATQDLSMTILPNSDNFTVNVENALSYETHYVAKIVEAGSGSNVTSDSFSIYRKKAPEEDTGPVGALKILPISQYTCLVRSASVEDNSIWYENAVRLHFYFASDNTPTPLPPNERLLTCHDRQEHGARDSQRFPRLELIPHHFSVWDQSDVRFFDQNNDQRPDINQQIQEILLDKYGISSNINIFTQLKWRNRPKVGTDGDTLADTVNLGFVMQPWVDSQSGNSFCLNQQHYHNSDVPVFNILAEIVGVDTEGIFLAEREQLTLTNENGEEENAPQDVIIIREGLLKKIWFYLLDGQHFVPDEVTAGQRTIHFYWPADVNSPYIRKSTQYLYTIRLPEQIGQSQQTGLNTSIRPHDKRFGCVPLIRND